MKPKAVIFDLGETLLNYGRVDTSALFLEGAKLTYDYLKNLKSNTTNLPPFQKYYRTHILSIKLRYFWSNVVDREFDCVALLDKHAKRMGYQLDDQDLQQLAWLWYQPLGQCAKTEPDIARTLQNLKNLNCKLAIISNTFLPGSLLDRQLDNYGIKDLFPIRIYSSDTIYRKPDPRIYHRALDALDVPADSAIMVGDKIREDIRGATRCGLTAVFKRGALNRRKRVPKNIKIIDCISELPEWIKQNK